MTSGLQKVLASVEKARADDLLLKKQQEEANSAREAAALRLANLKETEEANLHALRWEQKLKGMKGPQVVALFKQTAQEMKQNKEKIDPLKSEYQKALEVVKSARARLAALKGPFQRAAEEQGQAEKQKILGDLRKLAGLERKTSTLSPSALTKSATKEEGSSDGKPTEKPERKKDQEKPSPEKERKPETDRGQQSSAEEQKVTDSLRSFQQLLAARSRNQEEQISRKKELSTALEQLGQKAEAYGKSLATARGLAQELYSAAIDLKKRVGRDELAGKGIPEGITQALRGAQVGQFDKELATVLNLQSSTRQERADLEKVDPTMEQGGKLRTEVNSLVGTRLDALGALKRLDERYQRPR
jgi:hypothetical protein